MMSVCSSVISVELFEGQEWNNFFFLIFHSILLFSMGAAFCKKFWWTHFLSDFFLYFTFFYIKVYLTLTQCKNGKKD